MRYKIFLDTNRLFNKNAPLNEVFNYQIPELVSFLEENGIREIVDICLPEIVVKERVQHKLEEISKNLDILNNSIENLKSVGHSEAVVSARDDYKTTIEKNADDFISLNGIVKVPMPSISKEELIDRAITKLRPFKDNDIGFKDTLIYLSIVEDALKEEEEICYIFCTHDQGFTEDVLTEFRELTRKELFVLPDMPKVREKLDELVPLKLRLKERNKKLENIVLRRTGDLMLAINQTLNEQHGTSIFPSYTVQKPLVFRSIYSSTAMSSYPSEEEKIIGYNFNELTFNRFDELDANNFKVVVEVVTDIKYSSQESASDSWVMGSTSGSMWQVPFRKTNKTFNVEVRCNLNDDEISVVSVTSLFF